MNTTPSVLTSGLGPAVAALDGKIVLPEHEGWDEARRAWNLAVDQTPVAVVVPETAQDVAAAVELAAAFGLRVAAQGTGHGASTLPPLNDAILVKTSRLCSVTIDAQAHRARVGAGAVWQDVVEPAAEHGLVVLHGSSPDVGVVGYTLGGGMGWLARSHGLAANSVTAVELVTADGRLVRADHEHEPDLFWAVRGGGGSFGIVTAIELELYDAPELHAGAMFWPVDRAADVLRTWRDWTEVVPDEVTSIGRILHFPPIPDIPEPLRGGSFAVIEAVITGPTAESEALLAPLRELQPMIDTFAAATPKTLQHLHMDPPKPVPGVGDGMFLDHLSDAAIDAVVETAHPPLLSFEIRQLGGVLTTPPAGHGAAGALDARYAMFTVGLALTPELGAAVGTAVTRSTTALAPWASGRACLNFSDRPVDPARLYPSHTYRRLQRIKSAYDPSSLFLSNHPIDSAE
jgi:hypothetical protein